MILYYLLVNTKSIALWTALLTSCATPYTVRTPQGEQECVFKRGIDLTLGPRVQGSESTSVQVGLEDTVRRSNRSVGLGFDSQGMRGLAFRLEETDVGLYGEPVFTYNGISVSGQGGGTTFLSVLGGKIAPISPIVAILYGQANFNTIASNPKAAARNLLLRDTIPFLQLQGLLYQTFRIAGLKMKDGPYSLEEFINEIRTAPTNEESLYRIELARFKGTPIDGILAELYDKMLLDTSFLFSKMDVADLGFVREKIRGNIEESLSTLERIVVDGVNPSNVDEYVARLYHISRVFDIDYDAKFKDECVIKMRGTYLFLADELNVGAVWPRLSAALEYYNATGVREVATTMRDRFKSAFDKLGTPEFLTEFHSLYYFMNSITEMERGARQEKVGLWQTLLTARGRPEAKEIAGAGVASSALDADSGSSYEDSVYFAKGFFDLHVPVQLADECTIPDLMEEPYQVDLRDVVGRYHELKRVVEDPKSENSLGLLYERLLKEYGILLEQQMKAQRGRFEYYGRVAHDDLRDARNQFWNVVAAVEPDADYSGRDRRRQNLTDLAIMDEAQFVLKTISSDPLKDVAEVLYQRVVWNKTYIDFMGGVSRRICHIDSPLTTP